MVKTAHKSKADSSSEDSSSEDGATKAQEMALNNLKSQVIDMKAKLCQCIYVKSSTEEEIEKILAKCQELSDWIEEEATVDTEVNVLEEKLKELTDLTVGLHARVKQHKERQKAEKLKKVKAKAKKAKGNSTETIDEATADGSEESTEKPKNVDQTENPESTEEST